jgi:hypothetical protein
MIGDFRAIMIDNRSNDISSVILGGNSMEEFCVLITKFSSSDFCPVSPIDPFNPFLNDQCHEFSKEHTARTTLMD